MREAREGLRDIELESPLFNAAGLLNGPNGSALLRDVETLADTSIGGLTVGSWTIPKREGNAATYGEPVAYFQNSTGSMTNSLGLPNVGINNGEQLVEEILDIAGEKPVIFSASPVSSESDIGTSVEQSVEMINRLFLAGAKLVELNVSCPNIVTDDSGRKPIMGYDPQTMGELFESLSAQPDWEEFRAQLGIKLPPYIDTAHGVKLRSLISNVLHDADPGFITTSNTVSGYLPMQNGEPILSVPGGQGGLSGPITSEVGREQLRTWKSEMALTPIISTLGVFDGHEVAKRQEMGAHASAMVSRFWLSSDWKNTVSNALLELSEHMPENE